MAASSAGSSSRSDSECCEHAVDARTLFPSTGGNALALSAAEVAERCVALHGTTHESKRLCVACSAGLMTRVSQRVPERPGALGSWRPDPPFHPAVSSFVCARKRRHDGPSFVGRQSVLEGLQS